MISHINMFENLTGAKRLASLKINEIAARAARIKCLVLVDAGDFISPGLPDAVHHVNNVIDFQVAEMLAAQMVVRDQTDIAVA